MHESIPLTSIQKGFQYNCKENVQDEFHRFEVPDFSALIQEESNLYNCKKTYNRT